MKKVLLVSAILGGVLLSTLLPSTGVIAEAKEHQLNNERRPATQYMYCPDCKTVTPFDDDLGIARVCRICNYYIYGK